MQTLMGLRWLSVGADMKAYKLNGNSIIAQITILAKRLRTSLFAYISALKHPIIKKYECKLNLWMSSFICNLARPSSPIGLNVRLD